ncbi:MAG TPA: MFS transporter, partial [Bacteroidales bacterium]|nr:MFS transporter [Bacteroidales bacterium]
LCTKSIILGSVAILGLTGFYFRERNFPSPLLNIRHLSQRHLLFGLLTTMLTTMILMGFNFLFPFFFDLVRHLPPDMTGLLLMTFPMTTILISPFSGYVSDKVSARTVSLVAMALLVVATGLFSFFGAQSSYWFIIFAFLVFGAGFAVFYTANSLLIMSHTLPGRESMLSASIAAITYLGSAIGINLFENVFSFGFPSKEGLVTLDKVPAGLLVSGFTRAALFGILVALAGFVTTLISREKKIIPPLSNKETVHGTNREPEIVFPEPRPEEDLV